MVLKVIWKDFKKEVEGFISTGNVIVDKYRVSRTEEEFEKLRDEKQSWENSVITYVKNSFEPENKNFAYEFKAKRGFATGFKLGVDQKVKNTIEALKDEINGLDYYLKMLFISDAIIPMDDIDLEKRKNLDTEGKLDLILSKLYDLYDDRKYHSLKWILEGTPMVL